MASESNAPPTPKDDPIGPEVHEHLASAPHSPELEEERESEKSSDHEERSESPTHEARHTPSDSVEDRDGEDQSSSSSSTGSEESTSDSSSSSVRQPVGNGEKEISEEGDESHVSKKASSSSEETVDDHADKGKGTDEAESCTDGYAFSCIGAIDVSVNPALNVPRHYSWVSPKILEQNSAFDVGCDMENILKKINSPRRGTWFAEGMKPGEHAAIWPGELKFIMYDVVLSIMNIRPPFTSFQQTVLGVLNLAPSQLHPNGWAFVRAYELMCIHLERPVSVSLFFNIFEINRNKDRASGKHEHVSLRSEKNGRIFRLYSDSLKAGGWKQKFYFVQPVDEKAIKFIGMYSSDGGSLLSSKFHLGWTLAHYNRKPHSYKVSDSMLPYEDQVTKAMLQIVSDLIPVAKEDHRGIQTADLVKAATRSEVLAVLDKMGGDDVDWDYLQQMANLGVQPGGDAVDLDTPPGTPNQDEALNVSPVNTVHQRDLGKNKVDSVDPVGDLEEDNPEGGLKTRGRQQMIGGTSNPPLKDLPPKDKKRKHSGSAAEKKASKRGKKHSSSSKKHRPSSVYLVDAEFAKKNFEAYVADPLAASISVFQHLDSVVKSQTADLENRAKAAEEARDNEIKLKGEAEKRLGDLQKKLTNIKAELKVLEEFKTDVTREREEEKEKVKGLEDRINELEKQVSDAEKEILELKKTIQELETSLKEAEAKLAPDAASVERIAELEKMVKDQKVEIARQQEATRKCARAAMAQRDKGFYNALEQAELVNPGMASMRTVFSPDHEVKDGKIVRVHKATNSEVVLYPPPASS